MKTKTYVFTDEEILTMREALTEYWQSIKNLKPYSPIAIRNQRQAKALKEQFQNDAILI